MSESRLERTKRQCARQSELVDRQRQLVRRLTLAGHPTGPAVRLLQYAEQTLRLFRQLLGRLQEQSDTALAPNTSARLSAVWPTAFLTTGAAPVPAFETSPNPSVSSRDVDDLSLEAVRPVPPTGELR